LPPPLGSLKLQKPLRAVPLRAVPLRAVPLRAVPLRAYRFVQTASCSVDEGSNAERLPGCGAGVGVRCRAVLVFEVELVGVKAPRMAGKGDTQSAHERLA